MGLTNLLVLMISPRVVCTYTTEARQSRKRIVGEPFPLGRGGRCAVKVTAFNSVLCLIQKRSCGAIKACCSMIDVALVVYYKVTIGLIELNVLFVLIPAKYYIIYLQYENPTHISIGRYRPGRFSRIDHPDLTILASSIIFIMSLPT